MFGYTGKILKVDLSSRSYNSWSIDAEYTRKFLGGNGFAAELIHQSVPPDADAFSESNAVIFSTGPLTGSNVWGTGRGHAASISPLTGLFADSGYGGNFAFAQKQTGYDAIIITGKSETPVYVFISDDGININSADDVWGKFTEESIHNLREKEGNNTEWAVIGPAGENKVLFANIMCSGKRFSAIGRGGLGAVLGWKNCKGIGVKGSKKINIFNSDKTGEILKEKLQILRKNTELLTKIGTPSLVNVINNLGKLSTRNNKMETFAHAADISGEAIQKHITGKTSCTKCPVACGKLVRVDSGMYSGKNVKMPEYETIYALGSMLENRDIKSIFNANAMCDNAGLDTISMGVTLAFVADCIENGFIKSSELEEEVSFKDWSNLSKVILKTANREGAGDIFANGSEKIAAAFGGDSWKLLYSSKGMEIAGHSARGIPHMGLAYATSTRGGSHQDARPKYHEPEAEPDLNHIATCCIESQNCTAIGDSLVMCRFISERSFGTEINESFSDIINSVTGLNLSVEELKATGERIYNLERIINVQRGVNRSKDTLPFRVTNEPVPFGPSKGMYCTEEKLQKSLDAYYRQRGWDSNGVPGEEKLNELGLKP